MKKIYLCFKSDQPMFNTLISVSDAANTDRYYTGLAEAGTGLMAESGSTSSDVSDILAWNRSPGIIKEALPDHDYILTDEKTSQIDEDGALSVGGTTLVRDGNENQRCIYTQDAVEYIHIL